MHRNMHPGEPMPPEEQMHPGEQMPPFFWLEPVDVLKELFSEIDINLINIPPRNIDSRFGKLYF